jgi:hypothetical protein
MLTRAERLKIVQDLVDANNPASLTDYDASLRINQQNEDGTVDISLINEGEPSGGATIRVIDGTPLLLSVDLGNGDVRLIDTTPHTLFAIMYC